MPCGSFCATADLISTGFVVGSEAVGAEVTNGVSVLLATAEGVAGTKGAGVGDGDGLATGMGAHVNRMFMTTKTTATPTPATPTTGTMSPTRDRSDLLRVLMPRVCGTGPRDAAPRWRAVGGVQPNAAGGQG